MFKNNWATGNTGHVAAHNDIGNAWNHSHYDVKLYGAVGNGSTNDTIAIQAAIDAASAAGGGVCYFPTGIYLTDSLTGKQNVPMIGGGREFTTLKSSGSGNLLSFTGSQLIDPEGIDYAPLVTGLTFDGNAVGTIGIHYMDSAWFDLYRCTLRNFTDAGVDGSAAIQCRLDDCKFLSNGTGVRFAHAASAIFGGGSGLPANRILLNWCHFFENSYRAIDFQNSAQIIVENCELDFNGTSGDSNSATMWIAPAAPNETGTQGLIMRNCWLEANHGIATINFAAVATDFQHIIEDCYLDPYLVTVPVHVISVDGSGSGFNKVEISRVRIPTRCSIRDVYRTGTKVFIDINNSKIEVSGSGGLVRQSPMGSEVMINDQSQMTAIRLPNLTTTQRDAIASPAAGMTIYNMTTAKINYYTTSWVEVA